ncbi:MAG TPA: trigger factor, partial [Geobacterales bacterium]|nr:trigger factor [Geobacterales bacterium]
MQVTVEKVSSVARKLNFEIPAERVSTEIDTVFEKIRKNAAIKGFRKGKAPQHMIEKYYGERMAEDVLRNLVNESIFKALYDHKLSPVSTPVIEGGEVRRGESLVYSAVVEVMPEVEVKGYTGLEAEKEAFRDNTSVIEERLRQIQENMATVEPLTDPRPVVDGDMVTIDFAGFIGDEPIERGAGSDYQLQIGSGQFIADLEQGIIGMSRGEERSIPVRFPDSYGSKELAGKEANFKVTVKEISVRRLPELDDQFARQLGEFETMDQLN